MDSQRRHLCLVLAFSLLLAGFLLVGLEWVRPGSVAQAADPTRYVAVTGDDDSGSNDCTTSSAPCRTIQHAVDVALSGDEIRVAAGVYTGVLARPAPAGYAGPAVVTQVVYISESVTLRGGYATGDWSTSDPAANPTTIDAELQGRVLFIAGGVSPRIEGLRLTHGDATGLGAWNDDFAAYDAGGGGGVSLWHSSATLTGNSFTANSARWGGGLYLENSTGVEVRDNEFSGNFALRTGGGIDLDAGSSATIVSNTITSNTAEQRGGGGLCVADSGDTLVMSNTISGNSVTNTDSNQGGGGVNSLNSSNVTFRGNTLTSNSARQGGGLYLEGSSDITIEENTVSANTAADSGGGIALFDSSAVVLTDLTVEGNFAGFGDGGILFSQSSGVVSGGVISGNIATTGSGGGLGIMGDEVVTVTGALITHNQAADRGGGIAAADATITIADTQVIHNTAGNSGGLDLLGARVEITNSLISENDASDHGGGIGVDGDSALTLNNVDLKGNHAAQGHGAMSVNGAGSVVIINGGSMAGNRSDDNAGALGINDALVSVNGTKIVDNLATQRGGAINACAARLEVTGAQITGNKGGQAGGVDINCGGFLTLTSSSVMTNTATDPVTGDGGGVRVNGGSTATVQDCLIAGNTAGTNGGGVKVLDGSVLMMTGSTVAGNTAGEQGAGVAIVDGAATFNNVTVADNVSQGETGGITVHESTFTMTGGAVRGNRALGTAIEGLTGGIRFGGHSISTFNDVTIEGNSAPYEGGGISVGDGSNLTVNGGQVINNTVSDSGGGLTVHDSSVLVLNGVTVAGNTATDGEGGGIRLYQSSGTLIGGAVTGNTASAANGGGLVVAESVMTMTGTLVNENHSLNDGGISFRDGSTAVFSGVTVEGNEVTGETGGLGVLKSTVTFSDTIIRNNLAPVSAGMGAWRGTVTMHGGAVTGNTSETTGGGIGAGKSSVVLDGVTIANNSALDGGAGLILGPLTTAVISGGAIINNTAEGESGVGGGVRVQGGSTAVLTDVAVEGNTAGADSGGMWVSSSSATIDGGTFAGNSAPWRGGLAVADGSVVTVTGTSFLNNTASVDAGGGLEVAQSSALVSGSRFSGNHAGQGGGAINVFAATGATFRNLTVVDNTADSCAGIDANGNSAFMAVQIVDSVIQNNQATSNAGGVCGHDSAYLELVNDLVTDNQSGDPGSAVRITNGWATLTNVTVTGNDNGSQGEAVYANFNGLPGLFITVTNSILWGNTAPDFGVEGDNGGSTWEVTYSDVGDGVSGGVSNIADDPLFRDPGGGDYHLASGSPAIDAGTGAGAPAVDLDGNPRPLDGDNDGTAAWDMGAYEEPFVASPITGLSVISSSPTPLGEDTTLIATIASGWGVTYYWSFGDSASGSGAVVTHTYPAAGVYNAAVTAANGAFTVSASTLISIYQESPPINPGQETTAVYTSASGMTTTIDIPANAVTQTVELAYTPVAPATAPPPNFAFAGQAFELDVYQDGTLQPGFTFAAPVIVELHYSDADVDGLDENSLVLSYWTGSEWIDAAGTCSPASTYDRRPAENWLSVPICHLTPFALFGQPAAAVTGWTQVNTDGFGDPNNEAGASTQIYRNYLYVGTGNAATGGQLWRTRHGAEWTRIDDGDFGPANTAITGLADFHGILYAGTRNAAGGEVWTSRHGTQWRRVIGRGFGHPDNQEIQPGPVFRNYLYAHTTSPSGVEVWRTRDGEHWTPVSARVHGFSNPANPAASPLQVYGDHLYLGTRKTNAGGELWRCHDCDGRDWQQVGADGFGDPTNTAFAPLLTLFRDYLYLGIGNWSSGAEVWRARETHHSLRWTQVNADGFGDAHNVEVNPQAARLGDSLYVATTNQTGGAEVWQTHDGASWQKLIGGGWADADNESAALTEFRDRLYAVTTNPADGVQVWRRDHVEKGRSTLDENVVALGPTATTEVVPLSGGALTYSGLLGVTVTLGIPAGAVDEPITLALTPVWADTPPARNGFAGSPFELRVYLDGVLQPAFYFLQPVTVEVQYTDGAVADVDESALTLAYWDAGEWVDLATTCEPAADYGRQPDANRLSVAACELTHFALLGQRAAGALDHPVYLPLILRQQ